MRGFGIHKIRFKLLFSPHPHPAPPQQCCCWPFQCCISVSVTHCPFVISSKKFCFMLSFHIIQSLSDELTRTNLSLASDKMDIGNRCRPRSDAANAASDHGLHCLHSIYGFLFSIK